MPTTSPALREKSSQTEFFTRQLGVDAAPEKVFDDLAWLAAQICCAPMAIVSLRGPRGQRLKSKVGLTAQQAGRDFSICDEVLARQGVYVVKDALQDANLAQDRLVTTDPKIRFFAGAPLITLDGAAVGTLLVMDRVPRQLSLEQTYALEVLARQLVNQLEWRKESGRHRA